MEGYEDVCSEVGEESQVGVSPHPMTITKAGVKIKYGKIQTSLVVIDFSSNKFDGCIPEDIQILKALQFLNLSNKFRLSREIAQELLQLSFLEFFNLTRPIPQGKQFGTFENNSSEGNLGLYGNPLSKKCYPEGLSPPPPSLSKKDDGEDSWLQFGCKAIMLGYGSGLVNGLVLDTSSTR
ncbi:hypothetical protein GOBAR_DD08075 [Gossypium barbadense]|nr:hypothetical protein GOBAR_DD08075 [Gossypium barbadense]